MKKFIILGLIIFVTLLSAKLYDIKEPAKFRSWVKIGGDFIPIWDGRSNLGHPSYWFDSSFVEHGWFNYIQIDSGATFNYLDLDSLSVDKVVSNLELGSDSIGIGIETADSVWMYDDGSYFNIAPDNSFRILLGNHLTFTGTNFYSGADTLVSTGHSNIRWKEVQALRSRVSSPNKSDTGTVYYDANDTLHIEAEDGDVVKIKGIIAFVDSVRGQATFSAVCLIDTIEIAGITTNSFVFLTVKSATAPTSNLSWTYLNTDSITVHCLVADTALLRVNPYSWFRIE